MNKKAIVYTASGCGECNLVKQLLAEEGVEFEARDLLTNTGYQEEVERLGFLGVPVTVIGSGVVKGYKPAEIRQLLKEN